MAVNIFPSAGDGGAGERTLGQLHLSRSLAGGKIPLHPLESTAFLSVLQSWNLYRQNIIPVFTPPTRTFTLNMISNINEMYLSTCVRCVSHLDWLENN